MAETSAGLVAAVGRSYFPIALVARLPYAMMVVGVLTLVVAARGSLGLGGLTSAVAGLGTAIFGPLIGAAADRLGQRRVVLVAGVSNSLVLLIMTLVVYGPLPNAVLLALAFLIGATAPQVSPMSRSRLVGIISTKIDPECRARVFSGTMAYESAADEMIFVFGPMIVGVLAAAIGPAAAVIGASGLALIFVSAFALHRSAAVVTVSSGQDADRAPLSEMIRPALITVLVGVFGIGLFFGTTLTSLTSLMADLGQAERAGLVYGVMGIGSASLALAAGTFPLRFTLRARWLVFAMIMVLGAVAFAGVRTVPAAIVVLLVLGVGIGPTLVTQFSLAAERSPRGRSATVMTTVGSGVVVGQATASAITGRLAEQVGTDAAMLAPLAAAVVIAGAGLVNRFLTPTRPV
ncbi:MFS transporter [Microlunatus soli]|uniref:MFS transporter n=1 Tax=Microlunatus soli TaxID=630515 RepID=UPI0018D3FE8C|nr:MFS transporter [Microlunatus soli]